MERSFSLSVFSLEKEERGKRRKSENENLRSAKTDFVATVNVIAVNDYFLDIFNFY